MMQKMVIAAIVLLVSSLQAAAEEQMEKRVHLPSNVALLLARFENVDTHSIIQFGFSGPDVNINCFMEARTEQDCENNLIPIGEDEDAKILLSIKDHRFQVFRDSLTGELIVRRFEKGNTKNWSDKAIKIDNLPNNFTQSLAVVLKAHHSNNSHEGKFSCNPTVAPLGGSGSMPKSPKVVHSPPQQHMVSIGSSSFGQMLPPAYPAPVPGQFGQPLYATTQLQVQGKKLYDE